jgi:hypothetical protein
MPCSVSVCPTFSQIESSETTAWAYLEQIAFPNMFAATSALSWTTNTRRGVGCCSHSWRCGGGSSALHRYCCASIRSLLVPRALVCNQHASSVKTVVNLCYVVQHQIQYIDWAVGRPSQFLHSPSLCKLFTHATTPTTIYQLSSSNPCSIWNPKTCNCFVM